MTKKVAVLGAGSWGSILADILTENGHDIRLWSNVPAQVAEMNEFHTNKHYLEDYTYSKDLHAYEDLKEALDQVDAILFVVPTKASRIVAKQVAAILEETGNKPIIIHASKGLEQVTHKRISEVIEEEIPADIRGSVVVFSGPSHAEEVANRDLTTIVSASTDPEAASFVQDLFMNKFLRIYTNNDVIGVEMGAAMKNIIAVGAGMLHGMGYGDNAKAALITRGLAEIARLGTSFGANQLTFMGLSGVGDLIVTATSVHSRNWRAGDQLGQGKSLDAVVADMGMVIEGVGTAKAAYELAQQQGIDMPITNAIYDVLYNNKEIKSVIEALINREGKSELAE